MANLKPLVQATGRRKEATARVRLYAGSGLIVVNKKPIEGYFATAQQRMRATEPLRVANAETRYDINATVEGGGTTGQADAIRLGIARALLEVDPELRPALKKEGLLTRDSRQVESKKYGLRKARRAPQYTKR